MIPCSKSVLLALFLTSFAAAPLSAVEPVRVIETDEVIPTYLSGAPDPNPMFFFGADSQGAEGRIYPYPLFDNLTNRRSEKSYHLIYLENEFVKIGVLPEIGGRLFSAVDKTNGYDFVYRQHVIKPALIGLTGAWMSGGIEWNIPHHHRASTFSPVQARVEAGADGSQTIWVGELEVRHRMRWAVGYTLRPGSSVLECAVRIINRTPLPHSMLCFANVAVNTNENYQVIFPPRTQWVTFHAKTEFSEWPLSHQRYNGADFTSGVDVSWYRNHHTPNSMFAWNYSDDFFAGYDHGRNAGTMSVANHHVVPGKKFWTWGTGPRGRMWDEILTDADGPYIELMVGGYSDNQPDYSWMQPFETRAFTMNFYPFRDIGGVKHANLQAAVNLDVNGERATLGFHATRSHPRATVRLTAGDRTLLEETIAIDPAHPYRKEIPVPRDLDPHALRASLSTDSGELVAYTPVRLERSPEPSVFHPPAEPKAIANAEELFLAGQRVEQFHNPYLDPEPFWTEVLRRDPGAIDANTGLGRLLLSRARFAEAEHHLRMAVDRLTANHTTAKNVEPLYYLGLALRAQGKLDAAFNLLYRAAWSQEWKSPAYFALAEIASRRGDFRTALDLARRSLEANAGNIRAVTLASAALRELGHAPEAQQLLDHAARTADPLDPRLLAEQWLATKHDATAKALFSTLVAHPQNAEELAAEFAESGRWQDGRDVLTALANSSEKASPLVHYYLAYFADQLGDPTVAAAQRRQAREASPDYVFPFQVEAIEPLRRAIAADPQDARAPYYLGNLLFDAQPEEAIAWWKKSAEIDPSFPIVWRNLAQAYAHQPGDDAQAQAIVCLEKAVATPHVYPTHLAELDWLYADAGAPVEKRLALLERDLTATTQKDDSAANLISLWTLVGKTDEAIAALQKRVFNVWEGGTRSNIREIWTNAHVRRGLQRFDAKRFREALEDFSAALKYPNNLRAYENASGPSRDAEIAYWTGCAHEALGEHAQAVEAWRAAAKPPSIDPQADESHGYHLALADRAADYYRALALRQLGDDAQEKALCRALIQAGQDALARADAPQPPSESPSWRLPPRYRRAAAHTLIGLGHAGLKEISPARAELEAALADIPDHFGAKVTLERL